MATLSVTKNYSAGAVLTDVQLDAAFASIETFLNVTKLNADNIDLDNVTANLTGTQAANVVSNIDRPTASSAVSLGVAVSPSIASFVVSSSTSSATTVTNSDISIVTNGRPVVIKCIAVSGNNDASIAAQSTSGADVIGRVILVRGSSTIISQQIMRFSSPTAGARLAAIPVSSISALDFVGAGTHTYKIQLKAVSTNTQLTISDFKLVAYEL